MNIKNIIVSMTIIFITIIGSFLLTPSLYAQTYYIDFENGSDLNDGTSKQNPFKHCPGDDNATGKAASVDLSSNLPNTLIFKGGVQYNGKIDLDRSGNGELDRITYQGNTDANDWGTGRAIIDGQNSRNYGFYSGSARNYITINNFEIRYVVTSNIKIGTSSSNSTGLTITNCYMHEITNWSRVGTQSQCGISLTRPINSLINNNTIEKPRFTGISLGGARNTVISNNIIDDYFVWGIDVYYHGQYHEGVILRNNTLVNGWRFDGLGPHSDYIFMRQGSPMTEAGAGRNAVIEGNLLYNNATFSDHNGTAMITVARCKNVTVKNNILINPHSYYAMQLGWATWGSGHKVYNNTIYSPRSGCWSLRVSKGVTNSIDIKNNIMVGYGCQNNSVSVVSDYNIYVYGRSSAWNQDSWSNWTNAGDDINGSAYSNIADIKFVNTSGYPTACQNMDLRVQADSVAVNAGANNAGADLSGDANDFVSLSSPIHLRIVNSQ